MSCRAIVVNNLFHFSRILKAWYVLTDRVGDICMHGGTLPVGHFVNVRRKAALT